MRTFFMSIGMLFFLVGCSTPRVIVRDCQELQGTDGLKNCELVRKL